MNKVILCGRIGKDPETRTAASGTTVVNLSLATSERYKGEEQTTWHNLVAFGKTGEFIATYFKRGDAILVEGKIQNRSYQDKDGNTRYVSEVVVDKAEFVPGNKGESGSQGQQRSERGNSGARNNPAPQEAPPFGDEDMIPF